MHNPLHHLTLHLCTLINHQLPLLNLWLNQSQNLSQSLLTLLLTTLPSLPTLPTPSPTLNLSLRSLTILNLSQSIIPSLTLHTHSHNLTQSLTTHRNLPTHNLSQATHSRRI